MGVIPRFGIFGGVIFMPVVVGAARGLNDGLVARCMES